MDSAGAATWRRRGLEALAGLVVSGSSLHSVHALVRNHLRCIKRQDHSPVVDLHAVVNVQFVARLAAPGLGALEHGHDRARLGVLALDVGLAHQAGSFPHQAAQAPGGRALSQLWS